MDKQKIIDYLKIIADIFLIVCFLIGAYYYIAHTKEVNEALGFEKPVRLLELYTKSTGEHCICYSDFKDMPLFNLTS